MTQTKTRPLQLPAALEGFRGELAAALGTEVPAGEWPEDVVYRPAAQPEAIAAVLVAELHVELSSASIAFLFRESIKSKGRTVGAKASKAGAKLNALTGHDFVIECNWKAWRQCTSEQRIALVDHELEHCSTKPESGAWTLVHHDVEEFHTIRQRWGDWTLALRQFREIKPQLELEL